MLSMSCAHTTHTHTYNTSQQFHRSRSGLAVRHAHLGWHACLQEQGMAPQVGYCFQEPEAE